DALPTVACVPAVVVRDGGGVGETADAGSSADRWRDRWQRVGCIAPVSEDPSRPGRRPGVIWSSAGVGTRWRRRGPAGIDRARLGLYLGVVSAARRRGVGGGVVALLEGTQTWHPEHREHSHSAMYWCAACERVRSQPRRSGCSTALGRLSEDAAARHGQ